MLRTKSEFCVSNGRSSVSKGTRSKRKGVISDRRKNNAPRGRLCGAYLKRRPDLFIAYATRSSPNKKKEEQTPDVLTTEQSPDLVEHTDDLVDWHPWGEEAFHKASSEEKLIFLSVGYRASHWCYLMGEESFKNPKIAKLLNDNCIAIKVEREERPDVARVYSTFVQATLGYSGWPLTVFLTPELDPVFGATYLPTPAQKDSPSLEQVIAEVLEGWNKDREKAIETAREATSEVQRSLTPEPIPFEGDREDGTTLVDDVMDTCADALVEAFDEKYGGFEEEAKFPRPSSLKMLMRQFLRRSDTAEQESLVYLIKMVVYTLGALKDGGVHDHVGGGFHKFAVDRVWHVPHFEKMLVDNVQIVQSFLSLATLLPEDEFFSAARSTLDYLLRELRSPDGGFYSGQEADSFDEQRGEVMEGAFYVWKAKEIEAALEVEEYKIFKDYYNVLDDGNCDLAQTDDEEEEAIMTNCLVVQERMDEVAKKYEMEESDVKRLLGNCRKKIYEIRSERAKPSLDTKIVCGYNGMAISAFAEASRILHLEEDKSTEEVFPDSRTQPGVYLETALEIGEFIIQKLWDDKKENLIRFYTNGVSALPAFAEDYAYVISGFLDLYTCSGELSWLQWALKLQDKMDELFWDAAYGGYFIANEDNESAPFRVKYCFDTDEPSASSVALSNLFRFSGLIQRNDVYDARAKETMEAFAAYFKDYAMELPEFASSSCLAEVHPSLIKVVIIGDFNEEKTQEYLNAMHSTYSPSKSLIAINPYEKKSLDFWKKHDDDLMEQLGDIVKPRTAKKRRTKKGAKASVEQTDEIALPIVFMIDNNELVGPFDSPEKLAEEMQDNSQEGEEMWGDEADDDVYEDDDGVLDVEVNPSRKA